MASTSTVLRIGVLGASWIAPMAVIKPARAIPELVQVCAVAARDQARAAQYAKKHDIENVFPSYDELIASESIDAVYVPLPNSHHHEWTIKALRAGKHVLCEKPMACSVDQVQEMLAVAEECGKLLVEAFHYRFHPLAARIHELAGDTELLGTIRRVETNFCIPVFSGSDIRYNLALGGGACMDTGCYALNCLRLASHALGEPVIESATADEAYPNIDKHMEATARWEGSEAVGKMRCSLFKIIPSCFVEVEGERGSFSVTNFVAPHFYHSISIRRRGDDGRESTSKEKLSGWFDDNSTYLCQLKAFADAVAAGITVASSEEEARQYLPFHPRDSLHTAALLEHVYEKAGLCARCPAPAPADD